jgi:hypothetical protein
MKKSITMKVLMETMKRLETEAYKDHVPGYGKGRGKSTKNWSMTSKDFAAKADHADKDDELDQAMASLAAAATTKKVRKPTSPEDEFIKSLKVAAENLDFGDDTQTINYDLADTQEDEPYDTTEEVSFVDAAASALANSLQNEMPSFHNLSDEEMEKKLKDELMSVLQDMDATDLYDRD